MLDNIVPLSIFFSVVIFLLFADYYRSNAIGSYPRLEGNYRWLHSSYPFVGALYFALTNMHTYYDSFDEECRRFKYKTFACSMPLNPPFFVVTDVETIDFVLKNPDIFIKGKLFSDRVTELLGKGIFNSDGDQWHKIRKIAASLFTAS